MARFWSDFVPDLFIYKQSNGKQVVSRVAKTWKIPNTLYGNIQWEVRLGIFLHFKV